VNKGLKNILSFFLAVLILFSSTGIVIASHICIKSKKTDVFLFKAKGCCSKMQGECSSLPASAEQFKNHCCQLSISYVKLDVTSLQKSFSAASGIIIPVEQFTFSNLYSSPCFQSCFNIHDPDIASGGKNFLLDIHRLLI
jgi:hypothetical protein